MAISREIFVGKEEFAALNHVLNDLAKKYQVTPTAIALAWVLRYPGKMQAVIGTTKPQHVLEAGKAAEVNLTRKEWYQIYLAAGMICLRILLVNQIPLLSVDWFFVLWFSDFS